MDSFSNNSPGVQLEISLTTLGPTWDVGGTATAPVATSGLGRDIGDFRVPASDGVATITARSLERSYTITDGISSSVFFPGFQLGVWDRALGAARATGAVVRAMRCMNVNIPPVGTMARIFVDSPPADGVGVTAVGTSVCSVLP